MALILKDLNGNAYPVETVTNHTVRMNSDGMLLFNVIENEQTTHFINDISKMWRVENVTGDAEAQAYVIVLAKRKATKHKQYIEVTAKEEQFDYLETHRIYENVTGSSTAVDFFDRIFDGTPYSYTMLNDAYAKEWENAGDGQSRFDMFLKGLERYGFEFQYEPASKNFKLGERISRRPAYYISKKLNANDISFEEDATNFYTYARGYFDYDGADNIHAANQIREYPKGKTSPMIELFGIREAPPVTDGRVTDTELMDEMLEKQVEQSLKMSIELDFVTLGHNYPFAQPEIGDEIPVIDETINFNRVLRIQEIKTTRDAHHKIIKQTIVVGDPRREVRYKKAQSGAVSAINDLMAGRTKIKESVLPAAIKESTQMLMDTASELSFSEQGIMAVDKDNPNYVTLLNSSGLGVSKDGGQTFHNAITRGQINADLITTGSLNADYIRGGTIDSDLVRLVGGGEFDSTVLEKGKIRSQGKFTRTFPEGDAQYTAYTESWNGVYRSGLISKKAGDIELTDITRWLSLTDKEITTQREIHSASPDKKGARFIDFFADETFTSDVFGQGMHIYSGQDLKIESKYRLTLTSAEGWNARLNNSALEVNNDGIGLLLQRQTPFTSEPGIGGQYISLCAYNGVEHAHMGITSNDRHLSLMSSHGDVYLRGGAVRVLDSEGSSLRDIYASTFDLYGVGRITFDGGDTYLQGQTGVRFTKYKSEEFVSAQAKDFIKSSSRELKTNIEELKGGMEAVRRLKPVSFDYKEDLKDGITGGDIGFIAEDSPDISVLDHKAISVQKVATWAILGLKEQDERIQQLNEKVNKLEAFINGK